MKQTWLEHTFLFLGRFLLGIESKWIKKRIWEQKLIIGKTIFLKRFGNLRVQIHGFINLYLSFIFYHLAKIVVIANCHSYFLSIIDFSYLIMMCLGI